MDGNGKMTHPYSLILDCGEYGSISLSGQFEDDEWQVLERYSKLAETLCSTRLLRSDAGVSLSMSFDRCSGPAITVDLPERDDVRAFLHLARPFLLQGEPTNFYKVRNLLAKHLSDPSVHAMLNHMKQLYDGERMRSAVNMTINGVMVISNDTLMTWLNAYEYHHDSEKEDAMRQLEGVLSLPGLEAILLQLLAEKVRAILMMARLIRVLLGRDTQGTISI